MVRKIGLGTLWLSFTLYAFFLAPPAQPDTFPLIQNLSIGQWQDINPLVIALFNLMGIWPIVYTALCCFDGRGQKIPAWPFAAGSFALGAFIMLPYLILREPNPKFTGEKTKLLQTLESQWFGLSVLLGTIVLFGYGLSQGNWADFLHQWQTDRFIHVMSLDFCLLTILFPLLLRDDMTRRELQNPALFWTISSFPLLGPALYLVIRPPLVTD
jgi:hypothetical protein